ncbi:hypothetical protein B0H21DRAFT_711744 [Amylocystis lapponica]|nr:hypothetical protein B0H21DRAFT_711744 [Amylocystis lapponica]
MLRCGGAEIADLSENGIALFGYSTDKQRIVKYMDRKYPLRDLEQIQVPAVSDGMDTPDHMVVVDVDGMNVGRDSGITSIGVTNRISPETAAYYYFSSGGFSNYFSVLSYQSSAVSSFLNNLGSTNNGLYNPYRNNPGCSTDRFYAGSGWDPVAPIPDTHICALQWFICTAFNAAAAALAPGTAHTMRSLLGPPSLAPARLTWGEHKLICI